MATAPGRPPRASNIDDGTTRDDRNSKSYFGNEFAKPTVTLGKVAYGQDPNKVSVNSYRLLPIPDPAAPGKFYPARLAGDPGTKPMLTDFIVRYPVFRGGDPNITFIAYDPADHPGRSRDDLKWSIPSHVLAAAVKSADKVDAGERWWRKLLERDNAKNKSKQLDFLNWMYLAYGLMYERGADESYLDAPLGLDHAQPPLLLDLGNDTGTKTHALCGLLKPEYAELAVNGGLPDDLGVNKLFAFDPVGIKRGVFFRAFSVKSKDPRKAERALRPDVPHWDLPPEEKVRDVGYNVYAVRRLYRGKDDDGGISAALEEHAAAFWRRLSPIANHLIFPTPCEQVDILARHIKDPNGLPALSLFEYAFQGRPEEDEWLAAIPSEVRAVARGKVTAPPRTAAADGSHRGFIAPAPDADDDDDDVPPATAPDDDDDDDDEDAVRLSRARTKARPPARTAVDVSVPVVGDDDDEDDDTPLPPRKKAPKAAKAAPSDDDDDEDEAPAPPPKAKKATKAKAAPPDDDDDDDEEEDEAPPPPKAKKAVVAAPPDDDDDDTPLPPPKAKKGARPPMAFEEPPPTRAPAVSPRDKVAAIKARQGLRGKE